MRKIQPTYGIIMLFLIIYLWAAAGTSELYTNPVWDQDFPDPSVLRMPDGTFYAYATNGRLEGKKCHIRILKSQGLIQWTPVGDAIDKLAAFNNRSTRNWAPHIVGDKGRFYLYYSTNHNQWSLQNKQGMGIAVAVADSPEGPFVTYKDPLVYGEGFEHIDPMLFIGSVSGNKYLYWGSAHKPLKVRQMDDDLLHFKQGSETKDVWPCSDQQPYERLLEGPWVIEKYGKYYLFASGDNCCGDGAHYAVVVARADHPEGPFITRARAIGTPDSVVLECNDRWLAPGHNAVVTDTAGDDWLVYHAYDVNKQTLDENGKRRLAGREMLIDKIIWKDEWPEKITPSITPQPAPKTEDCINLALNPNDTRDAVGSYPHASSNSEYHGMDCFAARNAIDGKTENAGHGEAFPSWGPDKERNLWLKIDFGQPVETDKVTIYIRADFPHDDYWHHAVIEFSDDSRHPITLQKTAEPQEFTFPPKRTQWVRFCELTEDEPLGWCSWTEVQVWGHPLP